MRKIIALITIFVMTLSLCGCGEFEQKDLVGSWDSEISMQQFFELADDEIDLDDLPEKTVEKIGKLKMVMRITYYENGTCDTFFQQESFNKLIDDYCEIMIDYLKNGGLIKEYQKQGLDINTQEDLDALFSSLGTNLDDTIVAFEVIFKGAFEKAKDEIFAEKTAKKGYYKANKKPEIYTVEEDKIIITNTEDKKEIMYFKLENKNTMDITEMIVDYEEIDLKCTFKRVK